MTFEKNVFFLENTQKRKGGDHGVHREIYNIKRQSFKNLKIIWNGNPNDCITIVGINKSSEQMIYYDSYQVFKTEKFNFTN